MTVYVIRHKATQQIMPLMKKNKGYSHWNPGREVQRKLIGRTDIPRILHSEKQAKQVIVMWKALPNGRMTFMQNTHGEYEDDIDFKDDGRRKDDLEIVPMELVEAEKYKMLISYMEAMAK